MKQPRQHSQAPLICTQLLACQQLAQQPAAGAKKKAPTRSGQPGKVNIGMFDGFLQSKKGKKIKSLHVILKIPYLPSYFNSRFYQESADSFIKSSVRHHLPVTLGHLSEPHLSGLSNDGCLRRFSEYF